MSIMCFGSVNATSRSTGDMSIVCFSSVNATSRSTRDMSIVCFGSVNAININMFALYVNAEIDRMLPSESKSLFV